MILNEGSRDNLLKPYVELLNSKGIKCDISQAKRYFLAKFVNEANIRSLSLESNFYLAGVTRYYLEGKLTKNKVLNVFNSKVTDEFDRDICQRVSALILILRNAHIDSVGTEFEQPENFGEMKFEALMRKYKKKIDKELGIEEVKPKKVQVDNLDRNERVGKNYSFEIIYSFEQAKKYNKYTEPGAWCITYGQQHYNYYIRMLGIHYVIFKKDGYENVKREKGKNWKKEKPQDEYGNSLIALLQSNSNGEPVYITSRWNHGSYTDNSQCEADHAYTKDEFMKITGVSDADLQRIFKIWEKDKSLHKKSGGVDRKELNKERLSILRTFKYAQMRINGGNYDGAFENSKIEPQMILTGKSRIDGIESKLKDAYDNRNEDLYNSLSKQKNKALMDTIRACQVIIDGNLYYFMMDKKQIIFETIVKRSEEYYDSIDEHFKSSETEDRRFYNDSEAVFKNNVIICNVVNGKMIYDTKKHKFVEIDGTKKFKYIAEVGRWLRYQSENNETIDKINSLYYEVKMSASQTALLSLSTNEPLRLPNGSCWFENLFCSNTYNYYYRRGADSVKAIDASKNTCLCFVYDSASGEKYFYYTKTKTFLNIEANEEEMYVYSLFSENTLPDGVFGIRMNKNSGNRRIYTKLYNGDKLISFMGFNMFIDFAFLGNGFVAFLPFTDQNERKWFLYNYIEKKRYDIINLGKQIRWIDCENDSNTKKLKTCKIVVFYIEEENEYNYYGDGTIFSPIYKQFIKNPIDNTYKFSIRATDKGKGKVNTRGYSNELVLDDTEPKFNIIKQNDILNEEEFNSFIKKLVVECIYRIKGGK